MRAFIPGGQVEGDILCLKSKLLLACTALSCRAERAKPLWPSGKGYSECRRRSSPGCRDEQWPTEGTGENLALEIEKSGSYGYASGTSQRKLFFQFVDRSSRVPWKWLRWSKCKVRWGMAVPPFISLTSKCPHYVNIKKWGTILRTQKSDSYEQDV